MEHGMKPAERIIVALDCPAEEARHIAKRLAGKARWLKVGMTLYYREGPGIVREFREMGYHVFVDLKLHDIPHQVRGAAYSVVLSGADMFTVHASGGASMMSAAVDGANEAFASRTRMSSDAGAGDVSAPLVLGVTVLTSTDAATLASTGVTRPLDEQVQALAMLARGAGLNGVVCSPLEASMLRTCLGPHAAIVTPGVRLPSDAKDDQVRVMTPAAALEAGASHLVIGRPITQAADPVQAFLDIAGTL